MLYDRGRLHGHYDGFILRKKRVVIIWYKESNWMVYHYSGGDRIKELLRRNGPFKQIKNSALAPIPLFRTKRMRDELLNVLDSLYDEDNYHIVYTIEGFLCYIRQQDTPRI
jgi:hypothetical protein